MFGIGIWLRIGLVAAIALGALYWHHRVYESGVDAERMKWQVAQAQAEKDAKARWDKRQAEFDAAQKVSAKERKDHDEDNSRRLGAAKRALAAAQAAAGPAPAVCLRSDERVRALNAALGYAE